MFRQFLFEVGKFFKRTDFYALIGTFMTLLGVILPLIPATNLYNFFTFKNVWQLILYVVSLLFAFGFMIAIFHIIGSGLILWGKSIKINVSATEYIQDNHKPEQFSLRITNHERDDLTDCRATLLLSEQFYTPNVVRDIYQIINPNDSLMSWGGGSETEYINVPGDGGRKVLNIARHEGSGNISFLFHKWISKPQLANVKYHIVIKINGLLNGDPFRAITYEGYLRARNYITPPIAVTSYREGQNGEHLNERDIVYGGEPSTMFEFGKHINKDADVNENEGQNQTI